MKTRKLCLALSAVTVLAQASVPAFADTTSPAIWQQLASVGETQPHVASATATQAPMTMSGDNVSGQAMLFLGKKKKAGGPGAGAPAAALTIHPSLPEQKAETVAAQPAVKEEAPALVAMNDTSSDREMVQEATKKTNNQLIAQLAPDQLIAQGGSSSVSATPIPPVVTGSVDLEEFKPSNVIDLKVSQSRTFKLRNKIVRTSISDPAIAEPVVVAENQLVLLGKSPGGATLVIWDDAGNSVAIDLKVSRDYSQLQATLREIDPRIIVKPFSVAGGDRVLLMGDVDHPESVVRAISVANAFMDDRGMSITAANGRILDVRIGERGRGSSSGGGGQAGQLSQIGQVDRYTFFSNIKSNVSKATSIVSDGGRVTSLVKVRKVPLIVLHCTFMEMNSTAVRELGIQLGLNFTSSTFGFGIGGNNNVGTGPLMSIPGVSNNQGPLQFIPNPAILPAINPINGAALNPQPGLLTATTLAAQGAQGPIGGGPISNASPFGNSVLPGGFGTAAAAAPGPFGGTYNNIGQGSFTGQPTALVQGQNLFGIPGGAVFNQNGLANLFTAVSNFAQGSGARWSINPTVQGVITQNRARVLAEPTLVTLSGERASFLAGGEIPIIQSIATAGQSQQSVVFEPFGVRLNMIPVLLENGSLNIRVSPEERLISNALAINLVTVGTIPGFTVRKTQTTVEMKPGQELYISGLVSANHGREQNRTPLIGEVPVLGALYRSKAFAKNESELVVAVRPEIILPGTPGQLKLPEEIGKPEGPRDTNIFQVEPTIIDERYMTTGQADRGVKLPGVLPPGSPIPDNE